MRVRLKPPMHAGLFTSDFDASKALPDTVISYIMLFTFKHNYIPTEDQSAPIKKTYYCRYTHTVTINLSVRKLNMS